MTRKAVSRYATFVMFLTGLLLGISNLKASGHSGCVADHAKLDRVIETMTPDEKIAQLLLVSFDGTVVDDDLREMIATWRVGGIVFYHRNLNTPDNARALTAAARSAAGNGVPPFLAIDQEGGTVLRLRDSAVSLPGNMALGATASPELARSAGLSIGSSLSRLGFNMNLAPVLDVYRNPRSGIGTRSFGDRPEAVAELGSAFIEGQTAGGVLSVAKHFLGEGAASGDTHESKATVSDAAVSVFDKDLVPFCHAIAAGVPAIMTSHVTVPSLTLTEGPVPLTVSHAVVTGILREQLGFEGLVITDAMEMRGATTYADAGEVAIQIQAIEAGADIVLAAGNRAMRRAVFTGLCAAHRTGRLNDRRLDPSLRRVLCAKKSFSDSSPSLSIPVGDDLVQTIARRSITLVSGKNKLLPLTAKTGVYIGVKGPLRDGLSLPGVVVEGSSRGELEEEIQSLSLGTARFIVAAFTNHTQADVIARFARTHPDLPVIAISLGNPHDLGEFVNVDAAIAAYSSLDASQSAVLAFLRGRATAPGRLPITLTAPLNAELGSTTVTTRKHPRSQETANEKREEP
jgi:beta-N-acetylhexosaminidase